MYQIELDNRNVVYHLPSTSILLSIRITQFNTDLRHWRYTCSITSWLLDFLFCQPTWKNCFSYIWTLWVKDHDWRRKYPKFTNDYTEEKTNFKNHQYGSFFSWSHVRLQNVQSNLNQIFDLLWQIWYSDIKFVWADQTSYFN